MSFSDDELRAMLEARATRLDANAAARDALSALPGVAQLHAVRRASPLHVGRLGWLAGVAAIVAALIGLALGPFGGKGAISPGSGTPTGLPTPTDRLVTPPPYVAGTCPVTPITDLVGGTDPETLVSGVRWRYGGLTWQAGVGQKVGLWTELGGAVNATEIDAVSLSSALNATRVASLPTHVVYPEGDGPGFIFAIGLPTAGCWLLTAVGPNLRSSIVVEAAVPPATPPDPSSQNVPAAASAATPTTVCPQSLTPRHPPGTGPYWLDGSTVWNLDPGSWQRGQPTQITVDGPIGGSVPHVVAVPLETPASGSSQAATFLPDAPQVGLPSATANGQVTTLTLPRAGCWALVATGPTTTSTVVIDLTATPVPSSSVVPGGEIAAEQLVTSSFGWVRTEAGFRVTEDGGLTWQSAAWPSGDDPGFTDPLDGWVFNQTTGLHRTLDGGRSWSTVAVPGGPYFAIGNPWFNDADHGTFVALPLSGNGAFILATTDGGATWTRHAIALPASGGLTVQSIHMFDALHGIADDVPSEFAYPVSSPATSLASLPTLYRTADGGQTWQPVSLPRPSGIAAAAPVSGGGVDVQTRLFGAADAVTWRVYAGAGGVTAFYATHDAGQTWTPAGSIGGSGPVAILSQDHWFVASPQTPTLEGTTDGGIHWSPLPAPGLAGPARWLDFPTNSGVGWAGVGAVLCTALGPCPAAALEGTTDGGLTWSALTP